MRPRRVTRTPSTTPVRSGKTTNSGVSWQKTSPESFDSVAAVAVDSVAGSTVYIATGEYIPGWGAGSGTAPEVLRSDDGGATWTSANMGLPSGGVRTLTTDPHISGTLYAGTQAGVYRSRDGGRSWTPFSQRLAGIPITSLAITDEGRRLHAGTSNGVYGLEIARGPMDVAAGPAGESRVLVWDADRLSLGTVDGSGQWTSTPPGSVSWPGRPSRSQPAGADLHTSSGRTATAAVRSRSSVPPAGSRSPCLRSVRAGSRAICR